MPGRGPYLPTFNDGDQIALVRPGGVAHATRRVVGKGFVAKYDGSLMRIVWDFDEGIWTVPGDDWD